MTFDEFVNQHLPAVLRFAAVLTGDRTSSEDIVQEVLIRAHARWSRISVLDRPEFYVRKMVLNEFRSARRRSQRTVPAGSATDVDHRVVPDHAIGHADRAVLLTEIAKLPAQQRAVVVLRYYEGSQTLISRTCSTWRRELFAVTRRGRWPPSASSPSARRARRFELTAVKGRTMRTEDDLIAALATLESQAPDADEVMAAVRRRLANGHRSRLAKLVAARANTMRIRRPARRRPFREGSGKARLIAPLAAAAAVAAIAMAVALVAPGTQPTRPAGPSAHGNKLYPVPTSSWRPGDPSMHALAFGTLAGGKYRGHWCPWLSASPGSRPVPIVWPAGFRAQRHPLKLLDAHGTVVARGGEEIQVGGGLGPADHRICMLGHKEAFYAMGYPTRRH